MFRDEVTANCQVVTQSGVFAIQSTSMQNELPCEAIFYSHFQIGKCTRIGAMMSLSLSRCLGETRKRHSVGRNRRRASRKLRTSHSRRSGRTRRGTGAGGLNTCVLSAMRAPSIAGAAVRIILADRDTLVNNVAKNGRGRSNFEIPPKVTRCILTFDTNKQRILYGASEARSHVAA